MSDWTLEEEQIIRKYYRREGSKGIHKRMPYRTPTSIHAKAYRMGMQFYERKSPQKLWTSQELDILRQYYPIEGPDCYPRLPNRTRWAVQIRAQHEGLTNNQRLPWSQQEINILQKNIGATREELEKLLPNRSWRGIEKKVKRMLKEHSEITFSEKPLDWAPKELDHSQQHYQTQDVVQKDLPNQTEEAIEARAEIKDSTKNKRSVWSQKELDILKKNIGVIEEKWQELLPGRTKRGIERKIQELEKRGEIVPPGVSSPWTSEELVILKKYYPIEGIKCKKYLPNRSEHAVQRQATKLKLKVLSTWSPEEIEILGKNAHLMNKALQELLPGRASRAIATQKRQLGFTGKNNRFWSSQEDAILRHYYPIESMECKKRLPNRSKQAIEYRASCLGIRASKAEPWTTQELEVLRQFYPLEGSKCYKRLSNRTRLAVGLRAMTEGLTKKKYRLWSQKELNLLKKNIGLTKEELKKLLPDRTWVSIERKRDELKKPKIIRAKKNLPWTPEEVAILRQYYPVEGIKCQKRLPNRGKGAIRRYVHHLGLEKLFSQVWSLEETEILKKNSQLTNKALQKLLPGRTGLAISRQKGQLGLTKKTSQPWSSEEDAILQYYYPIEGLECKKRLPNRAYEGVMHRVTRLANQGGGLKFGWHQEEIDILKKNIDLTLEALQELLPGRTRIAIDFKRKEIRGR